MANIQIAAGVLSMDFNNVRTLYQCYREGVTSILF